MDRRTGRQMGRDRGSPAEGDKKDFHRSIAGNALSLLSVPEMEGFGS
jgi:hypothetical protein